MTTATVVAIVAGTCVGGFVSGVAGFAFALVSLGFWAWVIDPQLISPMAVFGSLVAQVLSLGAIRRGLEWRRLAPFLAGGVLGVPMGAALLQLVDPITFRLTVGAILVAYCSYVLLAPKLAPVELGGRLADACVGLVGGTMGGLAGLTGPAPTIWCALRGWDKDTQRSVFQTFNLTMQAIALVTYGLHGALTRPVLAMFGVMLPAIVLPVWLGARLYARIDERTFRRIVTVLLLLSGVLLLASSAIATRAR
jgi:uncharacterized protein